MGDKAQKWECISSKGCQEGPWEIRNTFLMPVIAQTPWNVGREEGEAVSGSLQMWNRTQRVEKEDRERCFVSYFIH